jgi:hypothetical protein
MNKSEKAFKDWLDSKSIQYIWIDQSPESFSEFLRGISKRPDFFVVVRNFGMIAIDVKEREINPRMGYTDFILDEEKEIKKYLEFERIVRIPVWFVFTKKDENFKTWYWIPLSKVLECRAPISSKGPADKFRAINPSDCITLQAKIDGLERLLRD